MAKLEIYESLDAVPEALRDFYVERDGQWVPDAPELFSKGTNALNHERRQRADAVKKAEEAARQLQELQAEIEQLKAAQATPPAPDRTRERMQREYDERLKVLEQKALESDTQRKAAEQKLADTRITEALRTAVLEAGVPKEAVDDLVNLPRFRQTWRTTEEGEPAPYDGDSPRMDGHTGRPLSAKIYTKEFLEQNKHWLPPSTGGGANGSVARSINGVITVSKSALRDAATYQKITAEAAKTGATVQYTDD